MSDVDRDWQFRMSLYYVKPEDANTFTCQTPRRQTNSVTVVVTGRENDYRLCIFTTLINLLFLLKTLSDQIIIFE